MSDVRSAHIDMFGRSLYNGNHVLIPRGYTRESGLDIAQVVNDSAEFVTIKVHSITGTRKKPFRIKAENVSLVESDLVMLFNLKR